MEEMAEAYHDHVIAPLQEEERDMDWEKKQANGD